MNQAQALRQLQTIDHSISEHKSRLKEIELLLADNVAVKESNAARAEAEDALSPWRVKVRDLELEIKSITTKTGGVEQRLYSGTVTNPKEMQDMQEELASLRRRKSTLEDQLLESMIEVESHQEALDDATVTLAAVRSEWEDSQSDLVSERATRQQQLDELLENRDEAASLVEPDNLKIYSKLMRNRRGVAVAELDGQTCVTCGVGQTTTTVQQVRQARQLVYCANCGRILVLA